MEHDLALKGRSGLLHQVPDAFSRLPPQDICPPEDIRTKFSDDTGTKPPTYIGPKGPAHNGESLNERYPEGVDEEVSDSVAPIKAMLVYSA